MAVCWLDVTSLSRFIARDAKTRRVDVILYPCLSIAATIAAARFTAYHLRNRIQGDTHSVRSLRILQSTRDTLGNTPGSREPSFQKPPVGPQLFAEFANLAIGAQGSRVIVTQGPLEPARFPFIFREQFLL